MHLIEYAVSTENINTKCIWLALFKAAFNSAVTETNIRSGHKACGIYTYNPSKIPNKIMTPSVTSSYPITNTHHIYFIMLWIHTHVFIYVCVYMYIYV